MGSYKRAATISVRAGTATRTFTVTQDGGDPSAADDCGSTLTSYCTLTGIGVEISHTIETEGDSDLFKFTAPSSGMYWFSRVGEGIWMDLLAADGSIIVEDDTMLSTFLGAGESCFVRINSKSGLNYNYTVKVSHDPNSIVRSPTTRT